MATKILVVEDEPMLSSLYRMVLERANYEVITADNATIAEELVIKQHPHLVVLDLLVPKQQGGDARTEDVHEPMGLVILRMVKGTTALRGIRVIIMSNLDSDEMMASAKHLGADRYLVKSSVDPHALQKHVDEVMHAS